ncbi:MAG: molybdopterin-binding protein [Sorangiineae bacterium]|nr:molybdopterin-binding protein [Polyangiaceae bacterium]MEB2325040.1 molybdopterin-binding protein [Sorangiineae bacterium]
MARPHRLPVEVVDTAAALLIGNELLSGKIHESNLVELARTLRALGIQLARVVMVPDDLELIAAEVRALSERYGVVFTSGGIGPTHDDITLEGVARGFGVEARVEPTMEALLRGAYGERITEGHLRMALVPEGARLATTPDILWPTVVMRNVWVLPGVPEIFRMKLAVVRSALRGPEPFVSRAVFTQMDEGELKPLLDRVVSAHPEVEVGSYPKWFDRDYKTKLTFDARDAAAVEAALAHFLTLLPRGEPQRVE